MHPPHHGNLVHEENLQMEADVFLAGRSLKAASGPEAHIEGDGCYTVSPSWAKQEAFGGDGGWL